MTDIEKVARAHSNWRKLVEANPSFNKPMELAFHAGWKAAIAAMQPAPQEPVAWLYEYPDFGSKIPLANRTPDLCNCGWTETPLYAFPTPPAGGSDAE